MSKKIRILFAVSALICAAVLLFALFCPAIHDHSAGEACEECERIALLKKTADGFILILLAFLFILHAADGVLIKRRFGSEPKKETPVTLFMKMTD